MEKPGHWIPEQRRLCGRYSDSSHPIIIDLRTPLTSASASGLRLRRRLRLRLRLRLHTLYLPLVYGLSTFPAPYRG